MFRPNHKEPDVRFLRVWRGRQPGAVERSLEFGVCDALVQRRVAEWHDDPPQQPQPRTRSRR